MHGPFCPAARPGHPLVIFRIKGQKVKIVRKSAVDRKRINEYNRYDRWRRLSIRQDNSGGFVCDQRRK